MSEKDQKLVSNKFVRACAERRHADVMLLIALGEDVNQIDKGIDGGHEPNSYGQNGLQMAMSNNDMTLVKILDDAGVNFDFVDRHGQPVDILAETAGDGFYEGVKYLKDVKGFAFPTDYDERGSFLNNAIGRWTRMDKPEVADSRVKLVRYLIEEEGFDADYMGQLNERPLTCSAKFAVDYRIADIILEQGVNPNYDARRAGSYRKVIVADGFKAALQKAMEERQGVRDAMAFAKKGATLPLLEVLSACAVFKEDGNSKTPDEDMIAWCERKIDNARKKLDSFLRHGADPYFANNDGYSAIDFFLDEGNLRLFGNWDDLDELHRKMEEAAQNVAHKKDHQGPEPDISL